MMDWMRGLAAFKVAALIAFVSVLFVGCGSDSGKNDVCDNITCEAGVCDTDTGGCVNPEICSDSTTCLNGFGCVDGACAADFPCEANVDCPAGICINSACLNPDVCEENSDCIPGYGCEEASCVEDACAQVECDRGVCSIEGECVNAAVCSNDTERTDCLDGYKCLSQECVDEPAFCEALACDRGVCSFEQKRCDNAEACVDDNGCVSGYYCEDGSCAANQCDVNMTTCPRGVCDPSSTMCINADTCDALEDCVDGYYCIAGACALLDDACAICDGNQGCDYVEATQSVFCLENSLGCANAIDCLDDRICDQGACQAPVACVNDALEANNDVATATDWTAAAKVGDRVEARICGSDVDVFTFDTNTDVDNTGTLVSIVTFDPEDIGLGELQLELLDPQGAVLDTSISQGGVVRGETTIANLNRGVYAARVKESGAISMSGIGYGVFFDVVPPGTISACAAARTPTSTTNGDTTSGASTSLGGSCVTERDAPEDIYTFTLDERSFVDLSLVATGRSTEITIDLRSTCEISGSSFFCEAAGIDGAAFSEFLDAGTYYIVVQSVTANGVGPYSLQFNAFVPVCEPGEAMCADLNTSTSCNALGTGFQQTACDSGCDMANGRCTRAPADVCYTAEVATGGLTKTLNWEDYQNDYDPGTACVGGSSEVVTGGADAAFVIELQPNEGFVAEISPGFDNAALYIVRNCDDVARTCVDGVNESGSGGTETIAYANTDAASQTIYLIADVSSEEATFDPAILTVIQGPVVCTPGATQCAGPVEQTCKIGGLGFDDRTCGFGCDPQTNLCVPPPNDQCGAGAVDVSAGGTFTGVIDEYRDDYDPGFSGCTDDSAPGEDAVYVINGTPGDVVTATLSGDFDLSLYAVTDCSQLKSCLAGADENFNNSPETIRFNIPASGPVYIIVDGSSSFSTSGAYILDVQVQAPDCVTPGPIACQNITTLSWCDSYGLTQVYTCNGDCVATTCVNPTGNFCHDAIPLTTTSTFAGSFADFDDQVNPGEGGCIRQPGNEQDGPDAIFQVNLLAGETLIANLATSNTGAGMYVMKGCGSPSSECVWAQPRATQLEFFAPTAGNYYLVVDSTFGSSAAFTLQLSSRAGDVCQPGGATCAGNVITVCNASGSAVDGTITCATGCTAGTCDPPATLNDTCADAYTISGPVRIYDEFGRFNDDYNPGAMGCTTRDENGLDHVYAVTLAPSDVLKVDLQAFGTFIQPSAYLVSDCADVTTSCLWGSFGDDGLLNDGYLNDTGMIQNLYLIIDSDSRFDDEPYILDVDIRPLECLMGSDSCVDANTLRVCTSYGLFETERCYFGCDQVNSTCLAPANDQCAGGIAIPATGGQFQGPIEQFTDDYNPGSSGCTGFSEPGPDATYTLSGVEGDVVTATLSGPFDGAIYVVSDCANLSSCIAGDDRGFGDDSITFRVPSTGTYNIIVDAFSSTASGVFTLDVQVQTPICTPGTMSCLDATTVQLCEAPGLAYSTATCSNGCGPFECMNPNGDTCFEALDATLGGQFSGTIDAFSNDYDPGFDCTGRTEDGPDTVYYVDATAGQIIQATLTATFNGALYATQGCGDVSSACIQGSDGSSNETIGFSVPEDGRYFLIVDTSTAAATGAFTLDVTISNPTCTANATSCADANTLETCDNLGLTTAQIMCLYGCSAGACSPPPNDQCATAMDATAGGTFAGNFLGATDDYTPISFGSCTGFSATGPDLAYSVTLTAGQTVTATLTATTASQDTSLYIVSTCLAVVDTECLVGDDQFDVTTGGTGETVSYTATSNETVYIIADNYDSSSLPADPSFSLVVTVQ